MTIALPDDFGKPRPALVVQADQFGETGTITLLLLSSTLVEAPLIRIPLNPSADNGLRRPSQIMIDKAMSVKRDKIGLPFGRAGAEVMLQVSRSLALFLGIA
ncbi:mRNA interferase MazF [Sphingomonas zeicaulis]